MFANLIDEEIKRDEKFRHQILQEKKQQRKAPGTIELPESNMNGWKDGSGPSSATTLRANNGHHLPVTTPGLAIGVATPSHGQGQAHHNHVLPPTAEEGSQLEKTTSQASKERSSGDYFSSTTGPRAASTPGTNGRKSNDEGPNSPVDGEKENQGKEGTMFGRKFKMSFGGMKKLGRTQASDTTSKPSVDTPVETPEDSDSRSSKTEDRVVEDNLLGVLQAIRHRYDDDLQEGAQNLTSAITPSLANETPVLKPPAGTSILIQEDRPDSGGVADLFEGTVASLGQQADLIETVAPKWLGEVLLKV